MTCFTTFSCESSGRCRREESLQQKCAGFLACMAAFNRKYPADFVETVQPGILKTSLVAIIWSKTECYILNPRAASGICSQDRCHVSASVKLRFMLRHCDDDILKMLQQSAPPADVDKIDCFRNAGRKYMKQAGEVKVTY